MATPLIRLPQEQGGTMYAFSSAARDLTRAYYNPDLVFEYSKFALIDLPVVATPSAGSSNNFIQFNKLYEGGVVDGSGIAPSYKAVDPDNNANRHFAQTFQNYALNLENFILNDDDFDSTIYSSDAEKILFKWLNHINAFKTKPANAQETNNLSRLVEKENSDQTGSEYNKVVRYIGEIDVSNDKNYQGNTYNEIFINVPSSVGYTPDILFKSSSFNTNATTYQPNSIINGRNGQTHPDPRINLESIADSSDGSINVNSNSTYNYGIDFNENNYTKIVNDKELNNLHEYSQRGGDFRFNAILVYYDLYSKSENIRYTNLYGIVIIDNWKFDPNSQGWYIPEFTKYKPNDVTGLNGNAYALKLNVKFNSSLDNVGVEKNINDFSTFSMDIFFDTTSALEQASKILLESNSNYSKMFKKVEYLETLLLTQQDQVKLADEIKKIKKELKNASLNFSNSDDLLNMISNTNQRLNQIINGTIPSEVQYNTDIIRGGQGIEIDKSNPTKITIKNKNYGYYLNKLYTYILDNNEIDSVINKNNKYNPAIQGLGLWTKVKEYNNLIRIYLEQEDFQDNLNIY